MTADTSSIPGYYLQFASDNAAGVCLDGWLIQD